MLHFICGTSFLLLYAFLVSLMRDHHLALLLILDRLLTFLTAFSTLVLNPSFSQSLSLHSHLSFTQAHLLEFVHTEFGSH